MFNVSSCFTYPVIYVSTCLTWLKCVMSTSPTCRVSNIPSYPHVLLFFKSYSSCVFLSHVPVLWQTLGCFLLKGMYLWRLFLFKHFTPDILFFLHFWFILMFWIIHLILFCLMLITLFRPEFMLMRFVCLPMFFSESI